MEQDELRYVVNMLKRKSLCGNDVLKICNNQAIIYKYPELTKYNNIDDVLGKYGAAIILYMTNSNYGHWVCIFKQNRNTLSFFDSYALMPDDELKFKDKHFRKINNQLFPHLTYLLLTSDYKIDYSDCKLQEEISDVSTCGRWVGLRLLFRHLTNDQFCELFKSKGIKPDDLAVLLTYYI